MLARTRRRWVRATRPRFRGVWRWRSHAPRLRLAFECALVAAVASALNLPLPGLDYDGERLDYDYEQGRADYLAWRRARQGDAS